MIAFAAALRYPKPPGGSPDFTIRPRWNLDAIGP
jgi:hypothetical protein